MKIAHLVLQEMHHRRGNFILSCLAVASALICLGFSIGVLRIHDSDTASLLLAMEDETRVSMRKFEDEIRKSMKGLGFNIYIFPEGQELGEVYAQGYASKTMPEEYVERLANSKIVTVNHLLPTLTQKMKWPERARTVVLIGVRGEVPLAHRAPKKPLIDPVEAGKIVMGFELAESLSLQAGDEVAFMGKSFIIDKVHPERGSEDDITLWMNLSECQDLLDKRGQINAIQALECNCATIDRLGEIRAELQAILPGTRIIETQSTALARAEARVKAKKLADDKIADAERHRETLRQQRKVFIATLTPIVGFLAMGMVCLLAYINVRERLQEVGVLRTIGVNRFTLFSLFLLRAFAAGLVGGLVALIICWALMNSSLIRPFADSSFRAIFARGEVLLLLAAAPLLAGLAAWLPAVFAALKDPAAVLRVD